MNESQFGQSLKMTKPTWISPKEGKSWHSFRLSKGELIYKKNAPMRGRLLVLKVDVATDIVGHISNLDEVGKVIFDGDLRKIPKCREHLYRR
jgi:hypothetical protein